MAKIKSVPKEIDFNEARENIRKEIETRYGGVAKFLNTEEGKKLGGMKIRVYLYSTGPKNIKVLNALCAFMGIGEIVRKIVVVRTTKYYLK